MSYSKAAATIRHVFPLSRFVIILVRLRRFIIVLVKFAALCAVLGSGSFIYNEKKRVLVLVEPFKQTNNNQYDEQYSRQLAVESTNVQMRRLYMKQPFTDSRLSLINCSIVPRISICAKVDFVVVVHVRADDAQSRANWRNTYGAEQLKSKYNYTVLFSVGRPDSVFHQRIIEEESALYDDILQFDFKDTYRNLTLKHLAELRYLASACNEHVVLFKIDEDSGWNVGRVSELIRNNTPSEELYCSRLDDIYHDGGAFLTTVVPASPHVMPLLMRVGSKPIRDPKIKWYVTKDEWNETTYPPYCLGRFYLVRVPVVKRMLSTVHLQRFFWLEDVFITGVLREAAHINITNTATISLEKRHSRNSPNGKIAFATGKKKFRHWFFVVNHERLKLN